MLVKAPNGGLPSEWIMSRRRGKRVRGRGKEGRGGEIKIRDPDSLGHEGKGEREKRE